jgi:hypothetical protein
VTLLIAATSAAALVRFDKKDRRKAAFHDPNMKKGFALQMARDGPLQPACRQLGHC